jgi:sugar phosphate isomerase/epimerase
MVKIGEPMEDIAAYSGWIGHAHIDYPCGTERRFPLEDDGYDYRPYLRALRESGYGGILSIEATVSSDFGRDARQSARYLEKLLREVAQ